MKQVYIIVTSKGAPSKRLERIFEECGERYHKPEDGNMIALVIGMETILQKCPHFKNWIDTLIVKAQ